MIRMRGYLFYPEIIGYMKILTASHFVWIKYDKEGDQVYAAGSGTYSYEAGSYTEKIRDDLPGYRPNGQIDNV